MYEIIEKNQHGVLVKNTTGTEACIHCKYERGKCGEAHNYCKLNPLYYFLPDSEFVDAYNSDTQKELINLRVELRVEKEKSKALENYLEYQINSSRSDELNTCSLADIQFYKGKNTAFNHVLEFIKNQK